MPLKAALADEDPKVRAGAVKMLARIADDNVTDILISALEDESDDEGDAEIVDASHAEAFESFDDVVSEAEAALGDQGLMQPGDVLTDEEAEPTKAAELNPSEDTQTRKKSGRKKISFV